MTQDVFTRPNPLNRKLFGLGDEEILKLMMILHGVCDTGDY